MTDRDTFEDDPAVIEINELVAAGMTYADAVTIVQRRERARSVDVEQSDWVNGLVAAAWQRVTTAHPLFADETDHAF